VKGNAKSCDLSEVLEVAQAMSRLRAPFWISGGWAIDLFLGHITREHHDVDVLVLRRDHLMLHDALKEFSLKKIVPHPEGESNRGTIVEWPKDERLELPEHQVNAYRTNEPEPAFQVMLGESSDSEWIFRRNPDVRMPLKRIGFYPLWGLPYLAPEIVLLFKAKHLEEKDRVDFRNAIPKLNADARRWLRDAIERTHPGHEWLGAL
jgi:hypothetical protein